MIHRPGAELSTWSMFKYHTALRTTSYEHARTYSIPQIERALEKVALNLGCIKQFLFGDDSREPTKESVISLAYEACKTELLSLLVKHLQELEFEARKDAAQVFGAIVRIRDPEERSPGATYVEQHYEIIDQLFQGCVCRRLGLLGHVSGSGTLHTESCKEASCLEEWSLPHRLCFI